MDFSLFTPPQLISVVIISLLVISIINYVIYNRLFPEFFTRKGIKKSVYRYLYNDYYTLIENIDIQCSDDQQLMIKQLLVSRYGIFILETCHHRGTIYGSHHQVKWLSKGLMHSNPFYNPHMAQQFTVSLLAEHLKISPKMIKTLIVFTGNSLFPNHPPSNTCKTQNLIKAISLHNNMMFSQQSLPNIIENLKN